METALKVLRNIGTGVLNTLTWPINQTFGRMFDFNLCIPYVSLTEDKKQMTVDTPAEKPSKKIKDLSDGSANVETSDYQKAKQQFVEGAEARRVTTDAARQEVSIGNGVANFNAQMKALKDSKTEKSISKYESLFTGIEVAPDLSSGATNISDFFAERNGKTVIAVGNK